MKNKDLIKILLTFPLNHEIRLTIDETIFSITSEITFKDDAEGYIYLNRQADVSDELPPQNYEHWYMGERWINDIDTFTILDLDKNDTIKVKYNCESHKFEEVE